MNTPQSPSSCSDRRGRVRPQHPQVASFRSMMARMARCAARGLHPVPRSGFTVAVMNTDLMNEGGGWVPSACTLPTAERPLRRREFDALFADDVLAVVRTSPTQTRLDLRADPDAAARAASAGDEGDRLLLVLHLRPEGIEAGAVALHVSSAPEHAGRRRAPSRSRRGPGRRPAMTGVMRAGQVAEAARVNVETLRYYERRGIIDEPERSPGGHRLYPEATVTTLRVIKAAQNLGFTLDEVAGLLEGAGTTMAGPAEVCRHGRRPSSPRSSRRSPTCTSSVTASSRRARLVATTSSAAPSPSAARSRSSRSVRARRQSQR